MEEELFKKKISKEEKLYIEAVGLQEAISCVLRFERKVISLNNAADKFEALGDYKDAKERAEECKRMAEVIDAEGLKETYENALRRQEEASVKSEYVDAIAEFKRVSKRDDYKEEAKKRIEMCKNEIARLESRAVWKRRFIVLTVLAGCIFIFMQTPFYPFAKGVVHQQMGEYEAAILNYNEASSLSWTKDMKSVCYYKLGMEKLEQGKKKKAVKLLKKAKRNKAARKELRKLERELAEE